MTLTHHRLVPLTADYIVPRFKKDNHIVSIFVNDVVGITIDIISSMKSSLYSR